MKVQLEAREIVRPIADDWISRGVARLVDKVAVGKLLRVRKLHALARPGVTVTLNGTTPTPYTRQLSSYSVWLMRVLTSFPNVRYRRGMISKVEADRLGRFVVKFEGGSTGVFDRVVTRYGPSAEKTNRPLAKRRSHDPHAGSWLLTPIGYRVPTNDAHIWKTIEPAIHRVASKLNEVERRRGSDRSNPLIKSYYVGCLLMGPDKSREADEIYRNPQAWLSAKLRAGIRPRYADSVWLAHRSRN